MLYSSVSSTMQRRLTALGFKIVDGPKVCYRHTKTSDMPRWTCQASLPGQWTGCIRGFETLHTFSHKPFTHMVFDIKDGIINVRLNSFPQLPPFWLKEWPKDPKHIINGLAGNAGW